MTLDIRPFFRRTSGPVGERWRSDLRQLARQSLDYCQNDVNVIRIAAIFVEPATTLASKPLNILVLNGPNLNLLGIREPDHYGSETLDAIVSRLARASAGADVNIDHMQSNVESELIHRVHACLDDETDGIILNPAAFTHTSVALRDALAAVRIPFVEVHLSNVYARESFRHHSYFSDLAIGVISGLGAYGYEAALSALMRELGQQAN